MKTHDLIPIQLICKRYDVPVSFINTLQEFQLVEIIIEEDNLFIHKAQIK